MEIEKRKKDFHCVICEETIEFAEGVSRLRILELIQNHIDFHKEESPVCRTVTRSYDSIGRLNIEPSLNLEDSELQQLFDLIVDYFAFEKDLPLSEYYGFWSEKDWGLDPRK